MSELILERDEIVREGITPAELQALAEKKSASILEKIKQQSENIANAKRGANNARDYKRPWYKPFMGPSKADKVADALVTTNDAVAGLSDLIQESVRFTCTSIQFAQVMHKTMAYMMVNGFKDSNGNIQTLAAGSKEFVDEILSAAEDFVVKQSIVEKRQVELQAQLDRQQEIDAEQSRRLDELETSLTTTKELDEEQEKSLRSLSDYTKTKDELDKEQSALIEKLSDQIKFIKPTLILSILSLIVSVVALALPHFR